MQPTFLFFSLGTTEMLVLGILGLLLFGRRLPEVGRSLGKSFVEFKSGLNDMKAELRDVDRLVDEQTDYEPAPRPVESVERSETTEASPTEDDASKS